MSKHVTRSSASFAIAWVTVLYLGMSTEAVGSIVLGGNRVEVI